MKYHHIWAAALPIVSFAASAQSSITLFGVVDVNVRHVKNSGLPGNQTMNSSGLSSGRLGFRGVEDLGGGLSASFWLESDLNADTGTFSSTGKFFQRRSTVSLSGGFGELRLGRDLSPGSAHTYRYDPFDAVGMAASTATSRMPDGFSPSYYRRDNAIQYLSPRLAGVQAQLMYSMDERPADRLGRHVSGRLSYDSGPLSLSLSYGRTRASAAGADLKQYGLGAAYDFGIAKFMGHFQREDLPFGTYGASTLGSEDRWLLGVMVPMGTGHVRAAYVRTDARKGPPAFNGSDAGKYAIGYVHDLSLRTALYGTVVRISNKAGADFSLSGGTPGLAAGGTSTGAEMGIRHSF
jgi:predicted porin